MADEQSSRSERDETLRYLREQHAAVLARIEKFTSPGHGAPGFVVQLQADARGIEAALQAILCAPAAAVSERPLWRPHTDTPKTTEPVTALIAGYNDEGDEKDESFIFGIYIWRRDKWVDEDSGSTAKAPFYWRFERDLLADLPPPNERSEG